MSVFRGQIRAKTPVYEAVSVASWKKEDELKSLKSQVAELDRKIALSLQKEDNSEVKKENVVVDKQAFTLEDKTTCIKMRM